MRGRCIDPGAALALELNKVYFLFENGPGAYYVSKFNNSRAHFGCYQAAHFELIQEQRQEWPQEPAAAPMGLEPGKLYKANLIWRRPGYKQTELKQYYVRAKEKHGYFFRDPQLKNCGGCFPLHWFADFMEIQEPEPEQVEEIQEEPREAYIELIERESGQLAFF